MVTGFMTALKVALIVLAALLVVAAIVTAIISTWTFDERWGNTGVALGFAAILSAVGAYFVRAAGW